ncbi:MAG: hypothetical protein JO327_08955 [Nitrososphaeraceae archaeon]|nr:hypothetical protein [Nitrososphaeraceae archaeon]
MLPQEASICSTTYAQQSSPGPVGTAATDIRVGNFPRAIAVNPTTNMIYAVNSHSNSISVRPIC